MTVYLLDYENVKDLSGISNLSSDDLVIIFYSKNANSATMDDVSNIVSSKAKIKCKRVELGKPNALDFQLNSYLGYLIKQNENVKCKYYIVSKDKGYPLVAKFWKKEKGINIQIIPDMAVKTQHKTDESAESLPQKQETPDTQSDASKSELETILQNSDFNLTQNEISKIVGYVSKYKTSTTINNNLNKLFKDSTKSGEVLKLIKPYIKK